jgi:hypothetical protein
VSYLLQIVHLHHDNWLFIPSIPVLANSFFTVFPETGLSYPSRLVASVLLGFRVSCSTVCFLFICLRIGREHCVALSYYGETSDDHHLALALSTFQEFPASYVWV